MIRILALIATIVMASCTTEVSRDAIAGTYRLNKDRSESMEIYPNGKFDHMWLSAVGPESESGVWTFTDSSNCPNITFSTFSLGPGEFRRQVDGMSTCARSELGGGIQIIVDADGGRYFVRQ